MSWIVCGEAPTENWDQIDLVIVEARCVSKAEK